MILKKIGRVFKRFDLFGETASFTFDNGSQKYNSLIGTILSIFIFAAVCLQALGKYTVMV